MSVLLWCLAAQVVVAQLGLSSWWLPDLSLVGLVLAVSVTPRRWLLYAVLAGWVTLLGAVRFFQPLLAAYLLIAWGVRWLARHWDATDVRFQSLMAASASVGLTLWACWLEGLWSLPIAVLTLVRVGMTGLMVPVLRRLWLRRA